MVWFICKTSLYLRAFICSALQYMVTLNKPSTVGPLGCYCTTLYTSSNDSTIQTGMPILNLCFFFFFPSVCNNQTVCYLERDFAQ